MERSLNVREANPDDLDVIVEFIANEAREAEGRSLLRSKLEAGVGAALRDRSIASYWLLVDAADEALGCISVTREWSDWNGAYYWWIQSVYIAPSHRGKGYLGRLLGAVRAAAEKQGCLELRLYVHEKNAAAIRAYEKAGFVGSAYVIMSQSQ